MLDSTQIIFPISNKITLQEIASWWRLNCICAGKKYSSSSQQVYGQKDGATFTITKIWFFNTRFSWSCVCLIGFVGSFTLVCNCCACTLVETQHKTDKTNCIKHFNVLQIRMETIYLQRIIFFNHSFLEKYLWKQMTNRNEYVNKSKK